MLHTDQLFSRTAQEDSIQPPRVQVHVSICDDNDTALNLPLGEMATADSVTVTQLQAKPDDDCNNPDEVQEVDEAEILKH